MVESMIQPGDLAPEFEGISTQGSGFRLSSLRGGPVVLYFYPRAGSLGCTYESIGFAKEHTSFRERGVSVVGVSVDSLVDQRKFLETCSLPFPLVADSDQAIARRFGVLGAFGHARRVTFLLDEAGRVLQVVDSIRPGVHVTAAKRAFLGRAEGSAAPRAASGGSGSPVRPPGVP
ncbi:MAG: redoxin domain-containing protein [Thermoplasmata archaeon]|nr:redoxin domain-containing protein [Thermoplasmata archaeon]